MVMLIEGVLIGVFAGLVLRPVLDAYVLWHSVRDYADEKGAGRAEERETHGA